MQGLIFFISMGIDVRVLEFLLHEHSYKPVQGDLLTIGRQSVTMSGSDVLTMLELFGLPPHDTSFDPDTLNQHGVSGKPMITDRSLFRAFSDCRVMAADINGYEGADLLFDICGQVPPELRGRFDFIIEGGSLDNVFDPFRMLANMTEMLAPHGRMLIFAWSNSHPTAYIKVSPDWLMDYFAVNEFMDCKLYAMEFPSFAASRRTPADRIKIFNYDPYVVYHGQVGYECSSIFSERPLQLYCIAEKGSQSTHDRTAIQKHYRNGVVEPYLTSIARFRASPRPLFHSRMSPSDSTLTTISDFETLTPIGTWPWNR